MTTAALEALGQDLRNAIARIELEVREGEDEIARQRAVIQRAARSHQNTAPHEARLGAFLHVHAARVTEHLRLQGELAAWLSARRRSMRDN